MNTLSLFDKEVVNMDYMKAVTFANNVKEAKNGFMNFLIEFLNKYSHKFLTKEEFVEYLYKMVKRASTDIAHKTIIYGE